MIRSRVVFVITLLSLVLSGIFPAATLASPLTGAQAPTATLNSIYASTPPVLDGGLNFGEWNYATNIPFHDGTISVVNDNLRLYVLLDVTGELNNDPSDYFWVTFDVNRNKAIDANLDLNYGPVPANGNLRYQFYTGPAQWTGLQPNTFSARAKGFGCFWADGSFSFVSFFPLRFNCSQHRVYELAFDLAEIGAFAGGTARIGVRAAGLKPAFIDDTPANFDVDFSNLITINLAPPPFVTQAPFPGATAAFEPNAIEVTQAVQHRDNSLPLVAGKTTVARVYAITANVIFPALTRTYLYGSVGGVDLPGSPMATAFVAPTAPNRNRLDNTANFQLPQSWTEGSVTFNARAVNQLNSQASSTPFTLAFTPKSVPTYWIVPVNTGTVASPVLPPNSEITKQESYLKAIYPLSDVNFVVKPWQVLGPVTGEPITALNTYYNDVVIAWFFTLIFTGSPPFTLPDQIYGMIPSGGGLSDPVWAGGAGRVARGFEGTSVEGTMAHEINHNLDRSATGTWGRHVNPGGTGCGAAGPDPSWPYANPNVNEVGFDTRQPWSNGPSPVTVIPSTVPDIMSYCQSGILPTKWISDYRWSALFNNFTTAAVNAQTLSQIPDLAQIPNVLYISGQVNKDGTGMLNPIMVEPGLPTAPITRQSDYSVELMDPAGAPISTMLFPVEFLDDPEEPVNSVYFNFQMGLPPGLAPNAVGSIVLKHGAATLDQITVSSGAPTIAITAPTAGASWSGTQTLKWNASDTDKDPLTFSVLYSPDNGVTWNPIAAGLTGSSLDVDTSTLGGSTQAKFRVIVTDGYNTNQADSAAITIAAKPPVAKIISPDPGAVVAPGATLDLVGQGTDTLDGVLTGDHLIWKEGATILGTGENVSLMLPPGLHTLSLTAVNTTGQTGDATLTIFVGFKQSLPFVAK
jgi:hypothetical protein